MVMAPSLLLSAAMALALLCSATATDYTVGAPDGSWDFQTNYSNWVASKSFKIGDSLVFSYSPSQHNVVEVRKADYDSCSGASPIKTYDDGNTKIELTSAGTRYFICSFTGHCDGGMKIAISVVAATSSPPPSGTPSSPRAPPPTVIPSAPRAPPPARYPFAPRAPVARPPTESTPETPKPVAEAPHSGAAAVKAVAAMAVGAAMMAMAF